MKLNLEQQLYKAGLDEKEAIIYTYLLKHGGGTPSQISTDTKINRSTVYKVLLRLSVKGLIGESKKGTKRYYFAEKPSKLKRYKKEQERILERQMTYIEDLMPKLNELYASTRKTTQAYYYEGDDIKQIYNDQVSYKNSEILAIANLDTLGDFWKDLTYWRWYIRQKMHNNITTKGFVPDTQKSQEVHDSVYLDVPKKYRPVIKKLPQSFFTFKGEYMIYGDDRISIINLKEGELSGVIIVDKSFHQMMKNFFNLVWNSRE